MKATSTVCSEATALSSTRVADYLELARPRLTVMVLFTVAAGFFLASHGSIDTVALLHTLIGTALVAVGASALNQLLERQTDALMRRTENRPLPAGRLQPIEATVFGCGLAFTGLLYLALALKQPWAALVAGMTFASYVFVYTPLKRTTPLNTLVGAVPGALPPIIGWMAVSSSLSLEAVTLFLVLFLWQIPHFLAIAWICREDYSRAGIRMLPVVDPMGVCTGRRMVTYCLALIPVSLMPVLQGMAGPIYAVGAILLGLVFLGAAIGFTRARSLHQARRVLRASLIYLPALLLLLLLATEH